MRSLTIALYGFLTACFLFDMLAVAFALKFRWLKALRFRRFRLALNFFCFAVAFVLFACGQDIAALFVIGEAFYIIRDGNAIKG